MPKQEFNEEHKPLAYFISFRCYGTWLHGDVRGSVDRSHNAYGAPFLAPDEHREYEEFRRLKHEPIFLDEKRRPVVEKTIREVCEYRNWLLRAINVRTNHVHTVVTADRGPEPVMDNFKAYATRRMTEAGLWQRGRKLWSRHGSTRWLWKARGVERAIDYVLNCQGDELPNLMNGMTTVIEVRYSTARVSKRKLFLRTIVLRAESPLYARGTVA